MGIFNWSSKEKETEKYSINVYCLNCKKTDKIDIEEGIPVKKALENEKCLYCKLSTIVQWSTRLERIEIEGESNAGMYENVDVVSSINWENVPDKMKEKFLKDHK